MRAHFEHKYPEMCGFNISFMFDVRKEGAFVSKTCWRWLKKMIRRGEWIVGCTVCIGMCRHMEKLVKNYLYIYNQFTNWGLKHFLRLLDKLRTAEDSTCVYLTYHVYVTFCYKVKNVFPQVWLQTFLQRIKRGVGILHCTVNMYKG